MHDWWRHAVAPTLRSLAPYIPWQGTTGSCWSLWVCLYITSFYEVAPLYGVYKIYYGHPCHSGPRAPAIKIVLIPVGLVVYHFFLRIFKRTAPHGSTLNPGFSQPRSWFWGCEERGFTATRHNPCIDAYIVDLILPIMI